MTAAGITRAQSKKLNPRAGKGSAGRRSLKNSGYDDTQTQLQFMSCLQEAAVNIYIYIAPSTNLSITSFLHDCLSLTPHQKTSLRVFLDTEIPSIFHTQITMCHKVFILIFNINA